MYWLNQIFAVNNCQVCVGNIGSFCLLETVGRYIKYFSSLTAFRHRAVKVGVRVDSGTIGDLVTKDKQKQSHVLWHWCLSSFNFSQQKTFYFLIKISIWFVDVLISHPTFGYEKDKNRRERWQCKCFLYSF